MKILPLFLFLSLAGEPTLVAVNTATLSEAIVNSDYLADFWYGDDGVECGEPSYKIQNMDPVSQQFQLSVQQDYSAHGCSERSFECQASYELGESGELQLAPIDIAKHCTN